ncbi:9873_t:CDS:2 [Paraglomus brasilianum]|uniref:9873_t:CDS:1 n=1 Tax=Paraglomus brasilianum TaxID=144538 RepID=A0A9N8ZNI8_9GLOM|nr:9873_t:CDS:2 [Paraglomus brasilianum]
MSAQGINKLQLHFDKYEETVEIAYATLILKRPTLWCVVVLGLNATVWQVYSFIHTYIYGVFTNPYIPLLTLVASGTGLYVLLSEILVHSNTNTNLKDASKSILQPLHNRLEKEFAQPTPVKYSEICNRLKIRIQWLRDSVSKFRKDNPRLYLAVVLNTCFLLALLGKLMSPMKQAVLIVNSLLLIPPLIHYDAITKFQTLCENQHLVEVWKWLNDTVLKLPTQSSQNADLLFQTNVDSIRPYSPPSNYREEAITATGRLVPGNRIEHDKMVPSSNITEEEKRSSIGSRRKKDQKDRSEDIELGERKVVIVEVKKLEAETVNEQENATKGVVKEDTAKKDVDMDEAKGQLEQTRQPEEKKDDSSVMPSFLTSEDKPSEVFQQDSLVIQNLPPPIQTEQDHGSETPKFETKDHMSMSVVGEKIKEALAESTAALAPADGNDLNDSVLDGEWEKDFDDIKED